MEGPDSLFKAAKPDPRVWMFLFGIVSGLTFVCGSRCEFFILFLLLALIMVWQHMLAAAGRFMAFYLVLLALNESVRFAPLAWQPLSMPVAMLSLLLFRLIPLYMTYSILLRKTQMNEWLIALEQLHIPKMLIIPLAMVYRYAPTVRRELSYIRDSLTMRGLNRSMAGMALHPVATLEQFMLPLLVRSSKLSDELSAAALCKGLDARCRRTSCTGVRFAPQDAACCLAVAAVAGVLLFLHYRPLFL